MAGFWAQLALVAVGAGVASDKLPAGFVDLADVAPDVVVDMRYAGGDNFLGRPVRGYRAVRCLLTREAARALAGVQKDLKASGLGLMVYDCYRPQRAVDDFVAWSRAPGGATNPRHHPVVPKSELFQRGYIALHSGHSRGSTVDLTIVPAGPRKTTAAAPVRDCRAIDGALAPDGSVNMGTTFDCLDERAHVDDAIASAEARRNRSRLQAVMQRHGFVPYEKEWWHFTLAKEPFPNTAFDFEIQRAP